MLSISGSACAVLMTAAERREAARLRSERRRRAHGIMPRRKSHGLRGPSLNFSNEWIPALRLKDRERRLCYRRAEMSKQAFTRGSVRCGGRGHPIADNPPDGRFTLFD
jgi:hypothetical protein